MSRTQAPGPDNSDDLYGGPFDFDEATDITRAQNEHEVEEPQHSASDTAIDPGNVQGDSTLPTDPGRGSVARRTPFSISHDATNQLSILDPSLGFQKLPTPAARDTPDPAVTSNTSNTGGTANPGGVQATGLPYPTALLNVAGFESPPDFRVQRSCENIDQTKYARLAADINETGWLPLIKAAYADELDTASKTIQDLRWEGWVRGCDQALAGMHPNVLNIITTGSLAQSELNDTTGQLREVLQKYKAQANRQPSIYIRQLTVGPNKESLTVKQAKDLATFIRQYTAAHPDKNDEAYQLDAKIYGSEWTKAESDAGHRALLLDKDKQLSSIKKHYLTIFGDMLDKVAKQASIEYKTHIPPMYYVGYTSHAGLRTAQHEKMDKTTNALVNLTYYLLELWEPSLELHMDTFPICLIPGKRWASAAEMLICRLARGYYYAGGFNQAPCGGSVESVQKVTDLSWQTHRQIMDRHFGYSEYLKAEAARRKALRDKPFIERMAALVAKKKMYEEKENRLRKEHATLRKKIDIDFWEENDFLKDFVPMWEEVEEIVEELSKD